MSSKGSSAHNGDASANDAADIDQTAGAKHNIDDKSVPESKRTKTTDEKEQQTIEDALNGGAHDTNGNQAKSKPQTENGDTKQEEQENGEEHPDPPKNGVQESSAVETGARADVTPSNILEKGIIYFFFRGRVGIDEPSSVSDIQRSYIVLRPIEKDAKLGEGPIGDAGNSRLIAIPKKVLPTSGRERWIAFVEKTNTTFRTLKDEFLTSNDYVTKTAGTRHTPAATPIGEGIYAITTTGRESHLAYMLTLPSELGEVQKEIGLKERGSFIISTRNPDYPPPKYAQLPQGPEYSKEIKEEFRSLRWIGTNPKHLDIVNTQFLLVGESSGLQKATQPEKKDEKEGQEDPKEELEKLEDEDTHRMEDLKEDDSAAIFADLDVNAKDYPAIQTTF